MLSIGPYFIGQVLSGQGGVSVGSYVMCNSNTTAISHTKLRLYVILGQKVHQVLVSLIKVC